MLTGNRRGSLSTISTSIHAMPNAHDRNASNLITSENRTLKRRHMQHLIGQNATIGCHTENISLRSLEHLNNLRRHTISLNDRQPQLQCLSLNRRWLKLLTSPTNSIGTSNNERNKRSQRRHSKIRRTHKHNSHKDSLLSTKAETATKSSGKPNHQPIRNNISTRTNIPKTKERAAIKAALSAKHPSAKTPIPGPTAPGRTEPEQRSPRC